MLTFLFGRPGSGKTSYIIEKIKESVESGKQTYLLVPEQQAFISESMLADLPASSALCFEVVSFSRLCEKVFGEVGGLIDSRMGSDLGSLIMWQTLREVSALLEEYGSVKTDRAFGDMMLSVIDELHANSVSAEDCQRLAEQCDDPALSRKLSDISLVYANRDRIMGELLGESAIAAENKLSLLSAALRSHKCFGGCRVFVDSFTSFTGEEHDILEEIAKQADELCISFCYEGRGTDGPHTESIRNTVKRFTRFARENGVDTKDVTLEANTRAKSIVLQELEKLLWDFSLTKDSLPCVNTEELSAVPMAICKNEYEETFFAALQILKAHAEGVKFSEIALIMRDCDNRKGIIDAIFERLNIPYFYSEKTDLSSTPVARLILSALRCITYNFRTSDVLTLLKTGLCGIEAHDADLFEDYCYTWSIGGNRFLDDVWSMNPNGYTTQKSERGNEILLAANRVRAALIPPLVSLRKKFAVASGNTLENCRALYEYLEELGVSESLCALAELELASGNVRGAGEAIRVYDHIVSVLTNIGTVLQDAPTNAEELTAAIEIMLSHTDMGSVPAVGDYVTVGSAATLRVENIKIAILLGLCDGEFPKAYADSGLLSENDKSVMAELGISLTSRESTVTSDELFYVYRAMTKPSDKLVLCTCSSSISGRALTPSTAWNRVRFIFPDIKPVEFDLARVAELAASMSEKEDSNGNGGGGEELRGEQADAVEIDPMYVRMLFGDRLRLSKSQISTFAECPYRYWCEYVLGLREQKVSAVSYADSGTIIHYVLEKFLKKVRRPDGSVERPSDDEIIKEVDSIISEYIYDINCPLPSSMMYSFSRLRDLSLVMVRSVLDEFQRSSFKIVAFEEHISDHREGTLRPMEIKIGDEEGAPVVSLGGVIDRIDLYDDGESKYLRVVDYKTGTHRYDVSKVSTGEDLQLPAYLFTAAQKKNIDFFGEEREILPASALFLSAEEEKGEINPVRSGFILGNKDILSAASADMDKKILAGISVNKDGEITGKAAVSDEQLAGIEDSLHTSIIGTARSMYSGKAPRTPSKEACGFCSIRSSCPSAYKEKH